MLIHAIHAYLGPRIPYESRVYSPSYGEPYIEFRTRHYRFQLTMEDGYCVVTYGPSYSEVHETRFNLAHPDSLQMIYEFVCSKRWK